MSDIDIDSICELSCLSVTEEQKAAFSMQIDKILDYMSVLKKVKPSSDPAFEWPIHKDMLQRDDNPQRFEHPLVKDNAPDYQPGGFSVPKILS